MLLGLLVFAILSGARDTAAQDVPVTPRERTAWFATSVAGPRSLVAGLFVAGSETLIDVPPEWHRTASAFAQRYGAREAAIVTSNGIEAALGAAWGEDPRYFDCLCRGFAHRTGHAAKLSILAARRDGRLAPAWARYTGTVASNTVQNAWLPPSMRTWQQMVLRETTAVTGRFAGNLWTEFWPDIRAHLGR